MKTTQIKPIHDRNTSTPSPGQSNPAVSAPGQPHFILIRVFRVIVVEELWPSCLGVLVVKKDSRSPCLCASVAKETETGQFLILATLKPERKPQRSLGHQAKRLDVVR